MEGGWRPGVIPLPYSSLFALLLLVLMVSGAEEKPGLAHGTHKTSASGYTVPLPFNLLFKSYNMNTTLFWDYNFTSATPHFQVEIKDYKKDGNWSVVKSCKDTLQKYCDLSKKFNNPGIYYKARVKAFVGTEESNYSIANDFALRIHGKVGPPTLNSSVENTEIIVYIWHPVTPLKDGNEYKTIHQFYDDFSYEVFYNNQTTMVSECDELGCTAYLENMLKDKTYCITAQGKSIYWDVKGEKSQEICVYIENKHFITQNFIIGCIVSFCCVLLSLVIGMKLLLKVNPKTPQSVTLSNKRHFPLSTQPESRFDPISITTEETKSSLEKPMLDTSDTSQTDEPGYRSSLTGTEKHYSEDGHEPRCINDHDARSIEELNCSNNGSSYFHTDSDNGMPLDSETLQVTENTPLPEFKCPSSSYGYDKPHVPFIC